MDELLKSLGKFARSVFGVLCDCWTFDVDGCHYVRVIMYICRYDNCDGLIFFTLVGIAVTGQRRNIYAPLGLCIKPCTPDKYSTSGIPIYLVTGPNLTRSLSPNLARKS